MKKRKSLKNKADKLWKERIHERDKVCQYCGKQGGQAHHIIGRRNHNVRWDLDNGIVLCSGCHTLRADSAHQDPLGFAVYFKTKYQERYKHLMSVKNELWDKNYEEVIKRLEEE